MIDSLEIAEILNNSPSIELLKLRSREAIIVFLINTFCFFAKFHLDSVYSYEKIRDRFGLVFCSGPRPKIGSVRSDRMFVIV